MMSKKSCRTRRSKSDSTKNIDSISSLEPESMKSLKEAELPGYDVFISFEGPMTLSVLKRKKGVGPQNKAILVANNNRKEENEVKLHSRRDAHKGKHLRRDAHKGNFDNYDRIGVEQPKAKAGVDYKKKYDITGGMDVDPDEHDEEGDFAKRIGLIYS
ncbi:hypothetical protein HPP92_006567 [Vanilla planifolia]|uniref:Uncharacterized protein n=1 Tax=Vanilla planifolia TaxID=51239 RepID=A0A835RPX2_VANPL|nr:hypothetical protein HPP92_006567 [Vanilla planifolia]